MAAKSTRGVWKGRVWHPHTKADDIVTALRAAGHWVERLHSGCTSPNGRQMVDLGSRGLPQVWLPALNMFFIVSADNTLMGVNHGEWYARALAAGMKVAIIGDSAQALERINQWQTPTNS